MTPEDPTPADPALAAEADHLLAAELAADAGRLLVRLRESIGFEDEQHLRDTADLSSHNFLRDLLEAARPADALLSEEGADDLARLAHERVWIVDPLDGTKEFGTYGRSDWAVHVALWVRGSLAVGAVALPSLDLVLSTATPPALPPAHAGPPRLLVSRTRPGALSEGCAEVLGAELVPMGSAGAKAMAVVRGEAEVYLHSGGQYEWDSAAPVAVALAAGLHASRIDGSPLLYNNADTSLPDLLICRKELAGQVLDYVASVGT